MACNMQLSCSPSSSTCAPAKNSARCLRRSRFRFCFSASTSDSGEVETENCATKDCNSKGRTRAVLVEKYNNGASRRYYLDGESCLRTILDEQIVLDTDELQLTHPRSLLTSLPVIVKDFILPAGFPGSVSEDYLEYMLWQFPTNITGWVCHTLVTSSLLKAVGIGSFPGTAAAAAAAIRWVSKDGIGAVGRLIIGGRFGTIFDDDPKQWRMYADFIGSAGSIFDLSTPLYPAYFLLLASLGNLTTAVARGLKDPSFRVIQNHFAVSGNLGDVAAKEEVWGVTAQLLGLGLGVLILGTPGLVESYPVLVSTWLGMRLLHLWLRYQSLSVLQFKTINLKRARVLARSHVLHSTVPGCMECNGEENILYWDRFLKPRIILGVPLEDMVGSQTSSSLNVRKLLKQYVKEKYILVANHDRKKADFELLVSLKKGATSLSVLRIVWQSYWIYENWDSSKVVVDDVIEQSLLQLDDRFGHFVQQLEGAGWDTNNITASAPKQPYIDEELPDAHY